MSVLRPHKPAPATVSDQPLPAEEPTRSPVLRSTSKAAHTRISAAWVGIWVAAAIAVLLLVFLLQNTSSVVVSFLWMHGSVPLAVALLIAAVGAAVVTMSVGAARVTQLRRRLRRNS